MNPTLKQINRQMKREFYNNRRSPKYKKLKAKFKKLKRRAVKTFYSDYVSELKETDQMANGTVWPKELVLWTRWVMEISK